MWEISKPIETISLMCGVEIPVLRMLAVVLEWKRIKKEWWEVKWFGPYLTPEELLQIDDDWSDQNLKEVPDDNEGVYRNKYKSHSSAASTLSWINDTYS